MSNNIAKAKYEDYFIQKYSEIYKNELKYRSDLYLPKPNVRRRKSDFIKKEKIFIKKLKIKLAQQVKI